MAFDLSFSSKPGLYEVPDYEIVVEQPQNGGRTVKIWQSRQVKTDQRAVVHNILKRSPTAAKDKSARANNAREARISSTSNIKADPAIARYRRLAPASTKHRFGLQPSLESLHMVQLRNAYITKLDSVPNVTCTRAWLADLFNRELSFPGLIAAVNAMCLAGLQADRRDDQLRMVARISYGRAVSSIQQEICRDLSEQSIERRLQVFLSIRVLGNCESFPGVIDGGTSSFDDPFGGRAVHTRGAAKYLQLCGPELVQHVIRSSPANIGLFRNLRLQYALLCVSDRKACFLSEPEWQNITWSCNLTTPIELARFDNRVNVLLRVCELLERSDNLFDQPESAWQAVVSDYLALRSHLDRWVEDLHNPTAYTSDEIDSLLRPPEGGDRSRPWAAGLLDGTQLLDNPKAPHAARETVPSTYSVLSELGRARFNTIMVDAQLLRVLTLASYSGLSINLRGLSTETVLADMFIVMRHLCALIPARMQENPETCVWDLEVATRYFEHCELYSELDWCHRMADSLDAISNVRDTVNPEHAWYPWTMVLWAAKPAIIRAPAALSRVTEVGVKKNNTLPLQYYYGLVGR